MQGRYIDADPYRWPYDGSLGPDDTALIVIDMQPDFCGAGGYVDRMGYDLSLTRAPIEPIRSVLEAMRGGGYHVLHTREGHRPDLSDLPSATKAPAAASWSVASRAGRSSPSWRRCRARP